MITVYSSPTCSFCHMAKAYLKSRNHKFSEKDVSIDRDAAQWVVDHTGQLATPVLDINGSIIIGFDRQQIDLALRT